MLQSAPIASSGTYSLIVGGSGGTTGTYTLQAILNAVFKPSSLSINSIGTAYNLGPAFESLGTTPAADRAGVVGTLGAAPADFYAIDPHRRRIDDDRRQGNERNGRTGAFTTVQAIL